MKKLIFFISDNLLCMLILLILISDKILFMEVNVAKAELVESANSAQIFKDYNLTHTDRGPYPEAQPIPPIWCHHLPAGLSSSPVIGVEGTIYLGSEDGNLYALNPTDGSIEWSYQTGGTISCSPVIGNDGTIYIGGEDGYIYALDPTDRSVEWSYQTGDKISCSPTISSEGRIYVGNQDGNLYALNPTDGSVEWSYQTGGTISCSPAIGDDGTIYIASDGDNPPYYYVPDYSIPNDHIFFGEINALNPDGSLKWSRRGTIGKQEISAGSMVYITFSSLNHYVRSFVYALNPENGNMEWHYNIGGYTCSLPAIGHDGTIYVKCLWKLSALNPDGTLKWSFDSKVNSSAMAVGPDDKIYTERGSNKLCVLDPLNGRIKWDYFIANTFKYPAAIALDGTVCVGDAKGKVCLFGPIKDNEPPELVCPADLVVSAIGHKTKVTFIGVAYDNIDPNPLIVYNPRAGSEFPIGIKEVMVTATDSSGNFSACTFEVTVSTTYTEPVGLADSAWPCRGYDLQHTGRSPYTGTQTSILKWKYQTGDSISSSPAIGVDGTIYIGSDDYNVYALNPGDGSLKWCFRTKGKVSSTPAIGANGTLYVGSHDGNVYAFKLEDGSLKWISTIGGVIESSPTIGRDGTIYIGRNHEGTYALDPHHGSVKWEFSDITYTHSSPVIGEDGTLYIGAFHGLYALDPNGTLKWRYSPGTGNEVRSSPAIGEDGTIYAGSHDGEIWALNPDGSLKWSYQTGGNISSSPAIGYDGTIYIGSWGRETRIYALNPDGSLKWTYQTRHWIYSSSPAIGADDTIYIGSFDGKIYALNPDGGLKWKYQTGNWIDSSPAIGADGTVYVGSYDHKIYAFGAIPKYETPPKISSSYIYVEQINSEGTPAANEAIASFLDQLTDVDGEIEAIYEIPTIFPPGPTMVAFIAKDSVGEIWTYEAKVIIEDTVSPVAICQDITVQLDANGVAFILPDDVDNGSHDSCGVVNTALDHKIFNHADIGNNPVTLIVSDDSGNRDSCEAIVTVKQGSWDICSEEDSGELDIMETKGRIDKEIWIPVRIQHAPNEVCSLGLELTYESKVLEFLDFKLGTLLASFSKVNIYPIHPGRLRIEAMTKTQCIPEGSADHLCLLKFAVMNGEDKWCYSLDVENLNDDLAYFSSSGGCFCLYRCNGDLNDDGRTTPEDALIAFQCYLGSESCPNCADVNEDGSVTPADALALFTRSSRGGPH